MNITIIGGGTAAWLTAAYLSKNHPHFRVSVIDKTNGEPIGVGEATLLDFAPFMQACGFKIEEWAPAVSATLKSGILFPDWGEEGNIVWHPFLQHITYPTYGQWDVWAVDQTNPFEDYGLPTYSVAKENKVDFGHLGNYAYHVDCGKLVAFVQQRISDFVTFIDSGVVSVNKTGNTIHSVVLENGRVHESDMFIDCTGFNSILKKQERVDLTGRLFCNAAVTGQIQFVDRQAELKPYAVSRAVDCGWIWEIPVYDRIGSGLVFNRDITSIDEAKARFVNHWGADRVNVDSLRVIQWESFYIKNFWEGNVVSIGLSAGFIEPLESTGLAIIIKGITRLSDKIKVGTYRSTDADVYNAQMINIYEDAVDFVSMHYANSNRQGAFWDYVRDTFKKSDTFEFYEKFMVNLNLPFNLCNDYVLDNRLFHATNWILWLIQLNYPVLKQVRWPLERVKTLNDIFLNAEQQRVLASIPHADALEIFKMASMV
jgi:tryptophan halogenase